MPRRSGQFFVPLTLAIAAAMTAQVGCTDRTVTRTATFELDATGLPAPTSNAVSKTVRILNERLPDSARARATADNKIEVDFYGYPTAEQYRRLLQYMDATGRFGFRITASPHFNAHRTPIDMAEQLSADQTSVNIGGKELARWVEVDDQQFPTRAAALQVGLIVRDADGALQVLVLTNDGLDDAEKYLESARSGVDEIGQPQVEFRFNAKGAALFGGLTGRHLPNFAGEHYNLGILLDNRLLSAPSIHDRVTDSAAISGSFSQGDVDFLVAVLNADALPYPLTLVAERTIDE